MSIPQTKAALIMQEQAEQLTSHQVISLLMEGAIERAGGVIMAIHAGHEENREILTAKLRAIINGLRESLDFDVGGTVALNLASLYDYMIERLSAAEQASDQLLEAVTESRRLISEVKSGWDNMDLKVPDLAEGA